MEAEAREILTRARALIEDPTCWSRCNPAADATGRRVEVTDAKAVCWCGFAAVDRIDAEYAKEHNIVIRPGSVTTDFGARAHSALAKAVQNLFGDQTFEIMLANQMQPRRFSRMWHVNQHLGHAAVLRVYDLALA